MNVKGAIIAGLLSCIARLKRKSFLNQRSILEVKAKDNAKYALSTSDENAVVLPLCS